MASQVRAGHLTGAALVWLAAGLAGCGKASSQAIADGGAGSAGGSGGAGGGTGGGAGGGTGGGAGGGADTAVVPDAGTVEAPLADGAGEPDARPGKAFDPEGCPDVFAQDLFPHYDVTISAAEWAALDYEFRHLAENTAAGVDVNPYHPVVFRYLGETITDAAIRLRGHSSWRHAIALDADPKMQFVIAFDQYDGKGRFHGLKKIELDMPREDYSYLRQRLALSYLRDAGIISQCANSAQISINGALYGLYTNLERMDSEWLERVFPEAPGGDLWSDFWTRDNNTSSTDDAHMVALRAATTMASLSALVDMDQTTYEWAAEAMMPDGDGFWGGAHNYELYDHPTKKRFVWLPHDLDATFSFVPSTIDPVAWWLTRKATAVDQHYLGVIGDAAGLAQFGAALGRARAKYDVATLQARVDLWAAQIEEAALADPHRPFDVGTHHWGTSDIRDAVMRRATFVDKWLGCFTAGGDDKDGDGSPWCRDCDDGNAAVHPGAAELCGNMQDDNCNSQVDEGC